MPSDTSQPQCNSCASIELVIMGRQAREMVNAVRAVHRYWAGFFNVREPRMVTAMVEQHMSTLALLRDMPAVDDQESFITWNKKRLMLLENYR